MVVFSVGHTKNDGVMQNNTGVQLSGGDIDFGGGKW